jgi:hypothetical protein
MVISMIFIGLFRANALSLSHAHINVIFVVLVVAVSFSLIDYKSLWILLKL